MNRRMKKEINKLKDLNNINVGYARVSSLDDRQKLGLELQVAALSNCQVTYSEKQSGKDDERPELAKAIELAKELRKLNKKVSFCVYKMDRLSRKTSTLLKIVEELKEDGIEFVSVKENIDTATPTGILMYQLLGIFAEFELNNLRQRTREGLEQARRNGVVLGKPPIPDKLQRKIVSLYKNNSIPVKQIAEQLNVSESTVYKAARQHGISRRNAQGLL